MSAERVYCHAARRTPSTFRRPPSMCLSNDNKLPNEYVQSYSIIATTGGGGGRPIKLLPRVRIRERVEGEERDVNTTAATEHEAEHACIPRPKGASREGRRTHSHVALLRHDCARAHRRSLLFLFVIQHAARPRRGVAPATLFPQIVTSNYYVRAVPTER